MNPRRLRVRQGDTSRRPSTRLGGTLEFMQLLWALHHGLEKRSKRMEATLGVTGQQRFVIRMIGSFPGITAGGLARLLHLHPSTVTGLLKRLERRGMIARRSHAGGDRRLVAFDLSPRGRRLDSRRSGTIESTMTSVLASLPPRRIAAAREVLAALADRFLVWGDGPGNQASPRPPTAQRLFARGRKG
jgi:MarR family transcriptional regulator, organic hydroperoxide resistance regulator